MSIPTSRLVVSLREGLPEGINRLALGESQRETQGWRYALKLCPNEPGCFRAMYVAPRRTFLALHVGTHLKTVGMPACGPARAFQPAVSL
jgi:hypothetical protein